jgi:hypothetical protein
MATVTSLATSTGETVGSGALAAVTATIEEGNSSDTSDNAATGSVTGGGGPETPWPSATFERGRRFKRVVLFGLLGAMVPVAIVWGLMMYELGKEARPHIALVPVRPRSSPRTFASVAFGFSPPAPRVVGFFYSTPPVATPSDAPPTFVRRLARTSPPSTLRST